jgi:hypothetical protein
MVYYKQHSLQQINESWFKKHGKWARMKWARIKIIHNIRAWVSHGYLNLMLQINDQNMWAQDQHKLQHSLSEINRSSVRTRLKSWTAIDRSSIWCWIPKATVKTAGISSSTQRGVLSYRTQHLADLSTLR